MRKGIFNEFRRVADRYAGQQIEVDADAGELIEVIDRLRSKHLTSRGYRAQRNEIGSDSCRRGNAATPGTGLSYSVRAVSANVEIVEVARRCALVVLHFEDYLILIVRLLDQIDIVLGVSVF